MRASLKAFMVSALSPNFFLTAGPNNFLPLSPKSPEQTSLRKDASWGLDSLSLSTIVSLRFRET